MPIPASNAASFPAEDGPILRPFSGAFQVDPHRTYQRLRDCDPVHRAHLLGAPFWVLTRHADVSAVLRDPRMSAAAVGGGLLPRAIAEGNLYFKDPPAHTRLRSLVSKAFLPATIEGLRDSISQLAHTVIDDALAEQAQRGHFDIVDDLAVPLSLRTIINVLGLPTADAPRLRAWTERMCVLLDALRILPGLAAAHRAADEVFAYFRAAFAARRDTPPGPDGRPRDLLCALISATEQDDHRDLGVPNAPRSNDAPRLSETELIATAMFTLMAGHETVTSLIGSGLWLLGQHPQQLARLRDEGRDHPELFESAIEEMLRCEPPAQLTTKTATADLTIGGRHIARGDLVVAVIAAANRDPAVFVDPDRFDIARTDVRHRHLSFSLGPHYCVGAALARLQCQIFLRTLLQRLPDLQIDVAGAIRQPGIVLRGLRHLPARARPTAP